MNNAERGMMNDRNNAERGMMNDELFFIHHSAFIIQHSKGASL
jgi:hypothetical protein